MQRRIAHWAWLLLVLTALLSACGNAAPWQPGQPLPPITANSNQLLSGGRAYEVHGVNYIHPSTYNLQTCSSLQFGADGNCPWEIAPIAADLDTLQRLGVNTVRVFLDFYVFGGARQTQPTYDPAQALAHFDAFLAEASKRGIYVLPVLLAKYPQDRFRTQDIEPALQLHVRPVVSHLAGKPGILAWDLFNEIDLGGPVDERCWDWDNGDYEGCFPLANERLAFIKAIHDEAKRLDSLRLTTASLGFGKNYFRPEGAAIRLADVVDVFSFHYYDDDPYNSGRYAAHWYYGKGLPTDLQRAIDELHALNLGKPILITELGFPTGPGARRTDADLRRDLRIALDTARAANANGVLLWPFQTDPDILIGDLFTKERVP